MEKKIGEMISGRIHSPQDIVEPEGQPGHRHVKPLVDGGCEHPRQVTVGKPPVITIINIIGIVIPVDKTTFQRRHETQKYYQGNEGRQPPVTEFSIKKNCFHVNTCSILYRPETIWYIFPKNECHA